MILAKIIRAFLSVDIDDEKLLSRIIHIQSKLNQSVAKMKLVERENIHFTWRFFGDTSVSEIDVIHSALETLSFAPFEIRISGVGAFPNSKRPRIIWIGVTDNRDELCRLKSETDKALKELGYLIEKKKFVPHATIARVRFVRNRQELFENLEILDDEDVGSMIVSGIRMKKSTLTPKGPIYETLWEIKAE